MADTRDVAIMIDDALLHDAPSELGRVESFGAAGLGARNNGLVLTMADGAVFHVTVTYAD